MVIAFSSGLIAYNSSVAALPSGQDLYIDQPKVGSAQNGFTNLVAYNNSNSTYVQA